jgi:uncharacterized protein
MSVPLRGALIAGVEKVSAWADLLDRVNVFPVADGDTGRNLVISLSPLRLYEGNTDQVIRELLFAARGNSGNIAAHFLSGFIRSSSADEIAMYAAEGRDRAWKAIANPLRGTMLSVFDALVEVLRDEDIQDAGAVSRIMKHLEDAVKATTGFLPRLKSAGVVDSGALGMFLFFDGFFHVLCVAEESYRSLSETFGESLKVKPSFEEDVSEGFCVDTVLAGDDYSDKTIEALSELGDSITVAGNGRYLKIHLHTGDEKETRRKLAAFGEPVQWSVDDLGIQTSEFRRKPVNGAIHVMTDAAGSVTRKDAQRYGVTLLDSYVTLGGKCLPETFFNQEDVYAGMRRGDKASTSQASLFERHHYYASALDQYGYVLYLCVGSVFTGNYDIVTSWKRDHDRDSRLIVIDTGTASGRLGLAAIVTARYSLSADNREAVAAYARHAIDHCREYIFPDTLKYLADGGRISKTGAFLGNMLNIKPVIVPDAGGAKKVAVVKSRDEQLEYALERLAGDVAQNGGIIMLEYSDNRNWIDTVVKPAIEKRHASAEIMIQPLSLTTGVHTGPGTWAVAYLPEN